MALEKGNGKNMWWNPGILNPTDPVIYVEKAHNEGIIAELYKQNSNDISAAERGEINYSTGSNLDYDNTRVNGIKKPEIRFNNYVLEYDEVDYFHLYSKDFYPTLDLVINDKYDKFFKNDRPGLNNIITVAITPELDGKYKTIKLDFYIEDYNKISPGKLLCKCKYKYLELEKTFTKVIKNKKLITETPDDETCISTFDMLKTIALDTGLGFQATDDCKDIFDTRTHLMQKETFYDFIPNQLKFGGIDKNSIFDVFIDLWGYITMVNLPRVFKDVEGEFDEVTGQLKSQPAKNIHDYYLYQISKTHNEDINIENGSFLKVYRSITNFKNQGGESNITFREENFKTIVNNYDLTKEGTITNCFYCYPYGGASDEMGILPLDLQVIENSLDGAHTEDYEFTQQKFLGFDMSEETPTIIQKEIVEKYNRKLNKEIVTIKLDNTNYGLIRGIVVYVEVFEYNSAQKRSIIYNFGNLGLEDKEHKLYPEIYYDEDLEKLINNEDFGIPRISMSGWYYITGVDYFYERSKEKITQTLTLVKNERFSELNRYNDVKNVEPTS